MITQSGFSDLLKPGLAWIWFKLYYPSRSKGQSKKSYKRARIKSFKKWIVNLPEPQEE